jgi:hypothetical protein
MMSRAARWWIAGLVLAAMVASIFWHRRGTTEPRAERSVKEAMTKPESEPSQVKSPGARPAGPLVGERILKDYGNPERPPEEDLMWMARALDNFALLVKGDNPLPLGANEDIANALRGRNKAKLRALPDGHPAFNDRGQIVDRWGTPLYFHARRRDQLDIRSAGPDREMWTPDDLHRQPNGQMLRGPELLAPSLFNESPAGSSRNAR